MPRSGSSRPLIATERGRRAAEEYLRALAESKARRTAAAIIDPVAWITTHFWVPELQAPMTLAPYQQAVLRQALTPGADGLLPYSTILWGDLKKSIKSSICAAVCLWWADTHPWSTIRIVANDLKQADSREAEYIRRAITLNPSYFVEQRGARVTGYTVTLANNSRIEAVPIDPGGEAGGGDDIIVFTELWAAKSRAAQAMWTETTLSPLKFGKSMRWVETYAGFTGESPLLEPLYRVGVEQGERIAVPGMPDLELYHNPSARLLALWNTVPRLEWQTPEYYAQEAAALTESEFLRVHRNMWQSSVQSFVPVEWWDACEDHLRPPPASRAPVVVGVDASVSGDCTALSCVCRHPEHKDQIIEFHTMVWVPPAGGKMDYASTLTPEIRRICAEYNVVEVAFDPYQLHQWAVDLRNEGVGHFREFAQGGDRLLADKGLYDLIRDRKLHHSGNPTLRDHIQNANAKTQADEDSKLRLVKRNDSTKIDGAVALSMSAYECLRLMLG